jgi:hypothetical protein
MSLPEVTGLPRALHRSNAKAVKSAITLFEFPKFELPNLALPTKVPEAFRETAEKGIAQAKEAYEKVRGVVEEANSLAEGMLKTVASGAAEYNRKVLEVARANRSTSCDCATAIYGAKSLSDLIGLSTA